MRIVCVGGGPAGLYFAILAKLRDPAHEVTVVERNPEGATYGWGVVFWDEFLDGLHRGDQQSALDVARASVLWQGLEVRVRGAAGSGARAGHLTGYGFSISRRRFLEILVHRAVELGVDVRHDCDLTDPDELGGPPPDLVVASDGVASALRERYASDFGTTVAHGRNRFIWLGTPKVFDAFTFAFERTAHGWVWFHAYPSAAGASTCIVECAPETWRGLGLDRLDPDAGTELLERIFADPLQGHRLLNRPQGVRTAAPWLTFREITNRTWCRQNLVLMGDAAHTTHFSIGSGTKLAVQDAIALADVLPDDAAGLPFALQAYDERRRAALRPLQEAAHASMRWFESVDDVLRAEVDVVRFSHALSGRRGAQPSWRYQLHRASQIPAVRGLRRQVDTARRTRRARRRAEP